MAYIGREPQVGNFQVCDAISVVNGQAAYTMQVSSTNVSPETANHVLCSVNGILQRSGSSFTVSGSTITFASNLVTGDVIDFIQILGSTLDLGVPSDGTVTSAKLSGVNEITVADNWRITANVTSNTDPISSNLEQVDTAGQGTIGSAMTVSSGRFTFPSTGIYFVSFDATLSANGSDNISIAITATTNNSSYANMCHTYYGTDNQVGGANCSTLIDVTDTANVKVSFAVGSLGSGSTLNGDSAVNTSSMMFIRLGDT